MSCIKILVVDHSFVVPVYRSVFDELNKYRKLMIKFIVPHMWRSDKFSLPCYIDKNIGDNFYVLSTLFANNTKLNVHTHFYPKFLYVMKDFNPDVLHINEEPWSFVALQFASLGKKFLFYTKQNIMKHYPPPFNFNEKYVFYKSSCAASVGVTSKEILIKRGYNKKIWIVPHFVDTDVFNKKEVNGLKNELQIHSPIVGYVGRLNTAKGIELLIEAQKKLNFNLLIIGGGELEKKVASSKNRIIGWVPHDKLPYYLSVMDILVLPSITTKNWREQFGRVLIEAMACKVPVIGSNSGEIPYVIGDAGLIFDEGNIDSFCDKIKLLIEDNKLKKELSERGYIRVMENFSKKVVANKIYNIYKWMVNYTS